MNRARLLLVLLTAFGCGRRGTLYDAVLAPLPLVATDTAIVQVVPQTNRAVIVTPSSRTPSAVVLSAGARAAVRVPNSELVAILTGTARAPRLELLDVETLTTKVLDAEGVFDRLSFSPDGRYGVLLSNADRAVGLVARNLNELGLLDVQTQTVARLQIDTESLAPRFVHFAPPQAGRRLVAVALERGVAIFDAQRPDVAPRRVALRPAGSSVDTPVAELLFSRDARWLFVRALGVDDVIVIELGAEVGAPVSASINFVAGGSGLSDLELAPSAAGDAVLATFVNSTELVLLDARGIQDNVRRLQLGVALTNVELISATRAVAWAPTSRTMVVWDVLDGRSGVAALTSTPEQVFVTPAAERAVVVAGGSGVAAVSTLAITDEPNRLRLRVQTIQLATRPSAVRQTNDGASVFLAVAPVNGTQSSMVTLDVSSQGLAEVQLDAPVATLFHLARSGQVAAEHAAAPFGDVSMMPAGATERLSVIRSVDFALTGDLSRPEDAR